MTSTERGVAVSMRWCCAAVGVVLYVLCGWMYVWRQMEKRLDTPEVV